MKHWVYLFFMLTFTLLPAAAHANLDGAQINWVVTYGETDTECAAEVEITSDQGGVINGSEKLTINGATWGDFSGLPTSGYNIGAKIAFATPDLQLRVNYNWDVTLDPSICQNLKAGDRLQFDGSFNDDLASADLETPMLNSALTWDINGANTWVDLTQNSLQVTNLAGEQTTLGNGPIYNGGGGTSTSTGGCFLASSPVGFAGMSWAILFAPLLALGLKIRRRK